MTQSDVLAGYRVRVRDSSLNVVAELDDYDNLTMNLVFNDVSRWVLTTSTDTDATNALIVPGAGIVIQREHPGFADDGMVVLSGVWDTITERYDNTGLHLDIAGPDDMYVIADELAYPSTDGNFANNAYDVFGSPITTPSTAPTLSTAATGGTILAGTYLVGYAWQNTYGQTVLSPTASIVTTGSTSTVTATIPALPAGTTAATVYFSQAGGSALTLQGTTATTTYTQTVPPTTTGQAPNSTNLTGAPAESVLYHYVSANIGPTAIASRKTPGGRPAITLGTDLGRGSRIIGRARFGGLLSTLQAYALASNPEIGFKVVQSGTTLQFQVYQPVDRSGNVRFGPDIGNVQAYQRNASAPKVNHVIVGGGGTGTARSFLENEDATAISTWKRRIVTFKDQRNTTDVGELSQAASQVLASGVAKSALSVTPIDTPSQQYLIDYGLGDKVTVLTPGASGTINVTADLIRQLTIQLQSGQGTITQPLIGQANATSDPSITPVVELEQRLAALESVQ